MSQQDLWDQGLEKRRDGRAVYSGNKWGGKYVRAPDVYHRIIQKGRPILCKLGELADVQGYVHDNNTGSRFPRAYFLKSVKNTETIEVRRDSPGVIRYGVKREGNSSLVAPILFPRTFGVRHVIVWNPDGILGKEFYKVIVDNRKFAMTVAAQLNSTFGILQREVLGLVNLGDGAIKFSAADVGLFEVIPAMSQPTVCRAFKSLATRALLDMPEELSQPDRRALDKEIFDYLGLTQEERRDVYGAVCTLVKRRLDKARSR